MNQQLLRTILPGIVGLVLMIGACACAGVGTTGSNSTLSGSITAVDRVNHTVTLNAGGQSLTIKGLSDQELAALQSQVGKAYRIQATQNSDGSFQIQSNTNPEPENNTPESTHNVTPNANETPNSNAPQGANEPGSISFIGKVQSVGNGNILVSMPDGSALQMITNNLTDFGGVQPSVGQLVKVDATANTSDGSFTTTKVKPADNGDLQDRAVVDYQGVSTGAVNADRVLHFKVGSKSFSYPIGSTADLSDFNGNVQGIQNNQNVKVTVQFQGSSGTVMKIGLSNGH